MRILFHEIMNNGKMSKPGMWLQEFIPCNSFSEPLVPNSLHLADAEGNKCPPFMQDEAQGGNIQTVPDMARRFDILSLCGVF